MTAAKHIEVLQTTLATDLKQCLYVWFCSSIIVPAEIVKEFQALVCICIFCCRDEKFSNGLKECSKRYVCAVLKFDCCVVVLLCVLNWK